MLPLLLLASIALIQAIPTLPDGLPQSSNNATLLWGPYRPNLYLGIRPRIPNSLLMGLMWSNADDVSKIAKNLRHTCEQDEGMAGYGWSTYDARNGGTQIINDTGNKLDLIAQFAKVYDTEDHVKWGLRVRGVPRANARHGQRSTVIFYLATEDQASKVACGDLNSGDLNIDWNPSDSHIVCHGTTMSSLDDFLLKIPPHQASSNSDINTIVHSLTAPPDTLWQAKSIFMKELKATGSSEGMIGDSPGQGNLHFVQKSFEGDFEFDILFSSGLKLDSASTHMTSTSLTQAIHEAFSSFKNRFELTYIPQPPFQDEQYIRFSLSLLSNLMGGIGYFYGTSKVDASFAPEYTESDENFWKKATAAQARAAVEEWGPYQLYSAVPSRPFFPRGFLWDEGFHLQVILDWDADLALEIVSSWFDLMDESGWIAREQILGPEARSKVPPEFQTQYPHYANPPTLFVVVQAFAAKLQGESPYTGAPSVYLHGRTDGTAFLKAIYPKMKKHYDWFCRSQSGTLTNYHSVGSKLYRGYRWRGRTPQHCLTSGLDDYPRAQPPHPEELHVDALSWVGLMTMALGKISNVLNETEDQQMFLGHETDILRSIDEIHWSDSEQAHCDTTVRDGTRVEHVCHKGYLSLFPFLVGLLGPTHPNLEAVLDLIRNPEELWSPYGIRSLSRKDHYYGSDENYWRSPVWININYMVVQRLLELAAQPGPHQQKMRDTYAQLRINLVNTVFNSWKNTGFAWEQYNPDSGKGQRTQHFTGWTALVVKIMSMPDLGQSGNGHQGWPQKPRQGDYGDGYSYTSMALVAMMLGTLLVCFTSRRKVMRTLRRLIET